MQPTKKKDKRFLPLIIGVSIIIPILVAVMYMGPVWKPEGLDLTWMPQFHAIINAITAMMLLFGLMAIKNKIIFLHKRFMTAAIALSALFLVSYVVYHSSHESTKYLGEGAIRYVYFTILISHIILAIAIVPLVLITYVRALSERFDKHKKLAKITWPIWMYVAVTGVVVYMMMQDYY